MKVSTWKDSLVAVGVDGHGLNALMDKLRSADAEAAAGTLDVVFHDSGLGESLLEYASARAPEDAPPPLELKALSRGLTLIDTGKWKDALEYFKEAAASQKAATVDGGASASALLELCRAHLRLPQLVRVPLGLDTPAGDGIGSVFAAAITHLTRALEADRMASKPAAMSGKAASHAQAAGHALAFLLHPGTSQQLTALRGMALSLLLRNATLLGDFRALAAAAAADGQKSASQPNAAWERRAEKSAAFRKVLHLTGLAPVKQALADIADKVRTA